MATFRSVLIGKGRKKVGDVVIYRRLGKSVVRSMPPEHYKNWKHPSEHQIPQQTKFKTMIKLLQLFVSTIRIGYSKATIHNTAFNMAMKENMLACFAVGSTVIDFSKLMFSKGVLLIASTDSHSSSKTTQQVSLTWIDDSGQGNALSTDQIYVAVYNKTTNQAYVDLSGTAKRADSTVTVQLPMGSLSSGDHIEIYSFFRSADNMQISNTMYWGEDIIA